VEKYYFEWTDENYFYDQIASIKKVSAARIAGLGKQIFIADNFYEL
jgi:hypothetical protein